MNIPAATIIKRSKKTRRKRIVLRPITTTRVIETDLFSIYRMSLDVWIDLSRKIVSGYDRNRGFMADADGDQIQWLVDQAKRDADSIIVYQTEKLGRWVTRVGRWHGEKTISSYKSATGLDIRPFIKLSDISGLINKSISDNVALIGSINADTRSRVEQVLSDAFTNHRNKKWVTDELSKAMGITKKRARLIAGDQTHKLNLQLTAYRNQELGIPSYIWKTQQDDRVRPAHVARHNKVFRWDTPPFDGHPGYPIGCRCHAAPILELD